MSNIANSILYATFAFGGLGAGAVTNLLGPRYTLLLGSLGYAFYIGSLWCFQTQGTKWFVYLGGAVLGACASLLWSARKFRDSGRGVGTFLFKGAYRMVDRYRGLFDDGHPLGKGQGKSFQFVLGDRE
jgi:hypothetical protein